MKYWRFMFKFDGKDRSEECLKGGFIGANYGINEDITPHLSGGQKAFTEHYAGDLEKQGKTRIGAGMLLGALWDIAKGAEAGDIVLSPTSDSEKYHVGKITDGYRYCADKAFRHRRPVEWWRAEIYRDEMSDGLRDSTGNQGTMIDISRHAEEIKCILARLNRA